jgi:predicted site-specific integrase-resolvase
MAKGDKVLSSGEVAQICHVAPRTAQKWIDAGLLKGYRIPGSRDRRVPVEEMFRFMKEHGIPVPADFSAKLGE